MRKMTGFCEAESTAGITSIHGIFNHKLSVLCDSHPEETWSEGPSCDGIYFYIIPGKHIKMRAE